MTNLKTTKRALLSSVVALLVCFTMLLGTTFAWFTDSVTSSNNIIQTGTLDVSLEHADTVLGADDDGWVDASTGAIFNYNNWEPGYTAVKYVKIENEGTLDLKFILNIIPNNEAEEVNLADVIEVYMVSGAVAVERDALTTDSAAYVGNLTSLMNETDGAAHGVLYADDADKAGNVYEIYTIALKMSTSAGNEYMGKNVGGGFAVQLLATQLASENDSFNNQYDADATYPNVSISVNVPADTTQSVTLSANGMSVEVPAAALPTGTTSVSLVYSTPTVDVTNNTVTYDSIELVDQNGDVIDLEGNTEVISVTLPAQTTFAIGSTVYIYHDGEIVASAIVNPDGTISYEAEHFCEVVVSTNFDTNIKSETALKIAMQNVGTYTLVNDIELSETLTIEKVNNKKITLDLGGNTLSIKNGNAIVSGQNLAIKNGTVKSENDYAITNTMLLDLTDVVVDGGINNAGGLTVNSGKVFTTRGGDSHAIYHAVKNSGNIDIKGGEFSSNGAEVIWADASIRVAITGGSFTKTEKESNLVYGNKLTITDGTFNAYIADGTDIANNKVWTMSWIKGGTFNYDPTTIHFLSDYGCTAVDNGDGTWTVVAQ